MSRTRSTPMIPRLASMLVLGAISMMGGCQIFGMAGVVGQNIEREKKVEYAQADGLRDSTVAVVVDTDMMVMYEYPSVVPMICLNLSRRIAQNVEGSTSSIPASCSTGSTRPWLAVDALLAMCEELADRVIWIDLFEFRSTPGQSWQWEGRERERGIVEIDGFDPDAFADVTATFPDIPELGRESRFRQPDPDGSPDHVRPGGRLAVLRLHRGQVPDA